MRLQSWAGIAVLLVAGLFAEEACGQCAAGGGGGGGGTQGGAEGGPITISGGARLLRGPGSLAYDVMIQERLQRAYFQAQYAQAVQRALAEQEKKARRLANAQQRRAAQEYRRQHQRDERIAAARQ